MKEGTLGIEYTFNYSFYSTDSLEVVKTNEVTSFNLDHISSHNLKNSIFFQYAFLDNVTFSLNIPFVYKWDKTSASNANNATDIGDLSLGARWQPFKSGDTTTKIINTSFTFPSGASPYKINTEDSLSTGSGLYSFSLGGSLSKTLDPILAFTSLYYGYSLPESGLRQHRTDSSGTRILTRVEPGDQISLSGGIGYALTYTLSVNISLQYSYTNNYTYHWVSQTGVSPKTSGIDSTSAALYLGTGWRISPKQSINVTAGIGLTNADPDFTLAFRIPFDFQL
jgi:long-subunit fatty acid transport protein